MLYQLNLLKSNTELVCEERRSAQYCDHALRILYSSVNDPKKAGLLTLEQTPLNRSQVTDSSKTDVNGMTGQPTEKKKHFKTILKCF